MGAKDSKPNIIAYEDAVKRVSDNEFKRIREAFKRCAGANGSTLSLEAFVQEVLNNSVPKEVAEWLYQACGGTKRGITFKDLLGVIVILTKGSLDEKIKLLWTLYLNNQTESSLYLYEWDFVKTLRMEFNSVQSDVSAKMAEILTNLFGTSERVTYEQFRSWLLIHKNATVMSQWLLTDMNYNVLHDLETPTFYQSLAGVTHLEERDIIELEKCFWSLSNSAPLGQLDCAFVTALLSPPLPQEGMPGFFAAFDENGDGHIDFKELCCGLSAACRGPRTERLKFIYKIFDKDRDGFLNKQEITEMVTILTQVANESLHQVSRSSSPDEGISTQEVTKSFEPEIILLNLTDKLTEPKKAVFRLGSIDTDKEVILPNESGDQSGVLVLSLEDFLIWSVENAEVVVSPFLDLVFEVCHIVLGLRPLCRHQERDVVQGCIRREWSHGLRVGQFWYLVSSEWWARWAHWTNEPAAACCPHLLNHASDDTYTSHSSESMASSSYSVSSGVGVGVCASRGPGPIDNSSLVDPEILDPKVRRLTGEGCALRMDVTLSHTRDFQLLPAAAHRALASWHGHTVPLPRQVIRPPNSDLELELYPRQLKILRHVQTQQKPLGVAAGGTAVYASPPQRYLAYVGAFSRLATIKQVSEFICAAVGLTRENTRLWLITSGTSILLECLGLSLMELDDSPPHTFLLEVRARDLTWPEEMFALSSGGGSVGGAGAVLGNGCGATGLHNLGNTCYMNAALQALFNTGPIRLFLLSERHLYDLVATPRNPRPILILRLAELCKEVWLGGGRSVAPLRVLRCVWRLSALGAGPQHDSQELLAWLLERVQHELTAQPDQPPSSQTTTAAPPEPPPCLISSLFVGRLSGQVECMSGHRSLRLDAYNMLSLPLPHQDYHYCVTTVNKLDGSVPVKYAVKVPLDATYQLVKEKLSELCDLPPERMLVAEVSGHRIASVVSASERAISSRLLHVYELPIHQCTHNTGAGSLPLRSRRRGGGAGGGRRGRGAGGWGGAVSGGGLCAPALFCFKKSKSEIVLSQSPPGLFDPESMVHGTIKKIEYKSNTLPKDISELKRAEARLKKESGSSPPLSVKSLDIRRRPPSPSPSPPPSPRSSPPSPLQSALHNTAHYFIAVHRKLSCVESYFIPGSRVRAVLFGAPIVVGAGCGGSGGTLYRRVWTQVAPLLSARPPTQHNNHATDCDDSLGYSYPFTLRLIRGGRSGRGLAAGGVSGGGACARCDWPRTCRGCVLPDTDDTLFVHGSSYEDRTTSDAPTTDSSNDQTKLTHSTDNTESSDSEERIVRTIDLEWAARNDVMLAIDWEPTALHLRYQTTREKACVPHCSLLESAGAGGGGGGVSLCECAARFTCAECVSLYRCDACAANTNASASLTLHSLPPILIIHLKRFQYVNNKWVKSQKAVNFPYEDFDPTPYLSDEPRNTILKYQEIKSKLKQIRDAKADNTSDIENCDIKVNGDGDVDLEEEELVKELDSLKDYHGHHLKEGYDKFDLKYRLYAVVSHSGELSTGHYVCYTRSGAGAGAGAGAGEGGQGGWRLYNDSSCRELSQAGSQSSDVAPRPPIDPTTAYILFYERQGLDYPAYLPTPAPAPAAATSPSAGVKPDLTNLDFLDTDDNDLRKNCAIV